MTPQVSPTAKCLSCNYLLIGLPTNVCPECGRAFDPADPTTFADPAVRAERLRLKRIRRWTKWARHPTRITCAVAVISIIYLIVIGEVYLFMVDAERMSPFDILYNLIRLVATGVLIGALCRQLRAEYARVRLRALHELHAQPTTCRDSNRIVWCCCVLGLILALWPLTFAPRFFLSLAALESAAKEQLASGQSSIEQQWVGLLHVNGIYAHNGNRVFFNLNGPPGWQRMSARSGLLYEPEGRTWSFASHRYILTSSWSIAEFTPRYTLLHFAADLLDIGRRCR